MTSAEGVNPNPQQERLSSFVFRPVSYLGEAPAHQGQRELRYTSPILHSSGAKFVKVSLRNDGIQEAAEQIYYNELKLAPPTGFPPPQIPEVFLFDAGYGESSWPDISSYFAEPLRQHPDKASTTIIAIPVTTDITHAQQRQPFFAFGETMNHILHVGLFQYGVVYRSLLPDLPLRKRLRNLRQKEAPDQNVAEGPVISDANNLGVIRKMGSIATHIRSALTPHRPRLSNDEQADAYVRELLTEARQRAEKYSEIISSRAVEISLIDA